MTKVKIIALIKFDLSPDKNIDKIIKYQSFMKKAGVAEKKRLNKILAL